MFLYRFPALASNFGLEHGEYGNYINSNPNSGNQMDIQDVRRMDELELECLNSSQVAGGAIYLFIYLWHYYDTCLCTVVSTKAAQWDYSEFCHRSSQHGLKEPSSVAD